MSMENIFTSVIAQFNKKQPLVIYRKPLGEDLNGWLQNEDTLYTLNNFEESGFVFSPFDDLKEKILLPYDKCKVLQEKLDMVYDDHVSELVESLTPKNELLQKAHIDLVNLGINAIKENKLKKVVLSRKQKVKVAEISKPEKILDIFLKLLKRYPSAFVYCWYHPKVGLWLGATPESLFSLEHKTFRTMALAGTQKFNNNGKIIWGAKEKEEQQMVSDYLEKALEHYVPILMVSKPQTARAGNIVHLKTEIGGTINNRICKLQSLIEKLHPTPAVCGLPKEQAKKFILDNEGYDREFYSGYLGEINIQITPSVKNSRLKKEIGTKKYSDLYVNLRCMKVKKNTASVFVGGGITKDSIPKDEWIETVYKAQTILQILS